MGSRDSVERFIERQNIQSENFSDVSLVLESEGLKFRHLWNKNILELYFENELDYREALFLMRDCFDESDVQSIFGVRSECMVVIQYDQF